MDKKILIIAVVVLILLVFFFSYKYLFLIKKDQRGINEEENSEMIEKQEKEPQQNDQVKIEDIIVEGGGTLIICSDRCGDGVCQKEDLDCKGGNLNCICLETPADCQQDCK